MYGIFDGLICAAEKELEPFPKIAELLEYPEVQADKGYYLSVLSDFNRLNALSGKLTALKKLLEDERSLREMLAENVSSEEKLIYEEELAAIASKIALAFSELSGALKTEFPSPEVVCKISARGALSSKTALAFFAATERLLENRGSKISSVKTAYAKNGEYAKEISFTADGADAFAVLSVLCGVHKTFSASAPSEEFTLFCAAAPAPSAPPSEKDLKIDLFHSSGAGGQNINKVETAVRITHIPTGTTVTCQDERSQLKNKRRALASLTEKLATIRAEEEKRRVEEDFRLQSADKRVKIVFDVSCGSMTDTRLPDKRKFAFPPEEAEFDAYINLLCATERANK